MNLVPCLLLLLALSPASGAERFDHLSLAQGLSQSTVLCIAQDTQGYLWFGTEQGLNRYDGYRFTVYHSGSGPLGGLSNPFIHALYAAPDGRLFIGSENGLDMLDPSSNRVQPAADLLSDAFITALAGDGEETLWVGTRNQGVFRHNLKTGVAEQVPQLPGTRVGALLWDQQHKRLWVGFGGDGLCVIDHQNTVTRMEGVPPDAVVHVLVRNDAVWVGTAKHGLFSTGSDAQACAPYTGAPTSVRALLPGDDGVLWVGTEGRGLVRLNTDDGTQKTFRHNPKNSDSPSEDTIRVIFKDREGVIWLGAKGIDRLRHIPFMSYYHDPENPATIADNMVRAIAADASDRLWIGTDSGGLDRLDLNGTVTHYRHNAQDESSLGSNRVLAVLPHQDRIWVGTVGAGLNLMQPATGRFTRYLAAPQDTAAGVNTVRALLLVDAQVWTGTDEGLLIFEPTTGSWDRPLTLSKPVRTLMEAREGVIWAGTDDGLTQLNPQTGESHTDRPDPDKPGSLGASRVLAVYQDSDGVIWAGTAGAGLARRNFGSPSFAHFGTADGLPDNVVYAILDDGQGHLWLSTNRGLCRFTPPTRHTGPETRNYGVFDGLRSNEYNTGSSYRGSDGSLFFGGIDGIDRFHPDQLPTNQVKPPVVLTQFMVFEDPVVIGRLNARNQVIVNRVPGEGVPLHLSWRENVFTFKFAALSYPAPQKNTYRYKMEGFNDDWIHAGTRREATYTNLDHGSYTFRVTAANGDGVWNEKGLTIPIHIAPPLWQTTPAYVLYAMLIVGALIAWRRHELGRLHLAAELRLQKVEGERLQEMDRMKSRFFANISHEFRTPLTLILGPLRRLLAPDFEGDPRKYLSLMTANGERLLRLVNQLLDLSRLESGRLPLQLKRGDLGHDLRVLAESFRGLAESREIDYHIDSTATCPTLFYDRDKMEKIAGNLLANAFRFTPNGGQVRFTLTDEQHQVVLAVRDTGPGVPKDKIGKIFDRFYQASSEGPFDRQGSGIGLALVRELVLLHGGTIQVTGRKGACFRVTLPTGTKHLADDAWVEEVAESDAEDPRGPMPELPEEGAARLLIIEDNAEVRLHLAEIFGSRYHVTEAADAERGFRLAVDRLPDLIVSDVMMPGTDGIELTRRLKTDERSSHIPVILLTARAGAETRLAGLETGADAFLQKPFDPDELTLQVANLIEQRRKLRERYSRHHDHHLEEVAVTSTDERFLRRAVEVMEQFMGDPDFSVETFGRELGMSRVQLYRKLQALTGTSPSLFIRGLRLKRAARLLRQDAGTVAEITFRVGFNDPSYFARCFKNEFGSSPSAYAKRHHEETGPAS